MTPLFFFIEPWKIGTSGNKNYPVTHRNKTKPMRGSLWNNQYVQWKGCFFLFFRGSIGRLDCKSLTHPTSKDLRNYLDIWTPSKETLYIRIKWKMWVPLGEYPKFGTTTYLLDKGSFFSGKRRKIFREQTDWVLFQGYGHFPFEYIYIYIPGTPNNHL